MTPIARISKHGHITTQGTITSICDLTAPNIYAKTGVTDLLAPTATAAYVYTGLSLKANQSTPTRRQRLIVYLLKTKASSSYVYGQVVLTANQSTTYTETEEYGLVSARPDKTYVDTQLALKANQSTTYTKAEVDNALVVKSKS